MVKLTRASLRGQREDERGGRLAAGHCTAQGLGLETAQLLHEVRTLHEGHVGEMQVAQDVVLEAARALLVRPRQVQAARVAAQALLVVVVVVVEGGRIWGERETERLVGGAIPRSVCSAATPLQLSATQTRLFDFDGVMMSHETNKKSKTKNKHTQTGPSYLCLPRIDPTRGSGAVSQ